MAFVHIEIDTKESQTFFRLVSDAIKPETILRVIGARFQSYVDESFRTSGRGQWRPLSGLTMLLRKHGGSLPLQDSGRYKQSFVTETDNKTFVEVGSNLKVASGIPLAKIHEFGTGPYTIRAQKARVLAAQTRAGAWLYFGKEVRHPGIPARPVLPTNQVAERLVQDSLNAMLSRVEASKG